MTDVDKIMATWERGYEMGFEAGIQYQQGMTRIEEMELAEVRRRGGPFDTPEVRANTKTMMGYLKDFLNNVRPKGHQAPDPTQSPRTSEGNPT